MVQLEALYVHALHVNVLLDTSKHDCASRIWPFPAWLRSAILGSPETLNAKAKLFDG
jgi:hypothetical protein